MLKILTVTGASTEEEPAESEGQHDTGDWHQWSSQHKPWSRGNFDTVWAPVKKNESESPWSDPAPCITNSHINLTTPSCCFPLENGSLHPQSGAGLTPSTLGLQRSLWEDVNSAPSHLQKRVTRDLLDPWSRVWSTGSVREAEVKSRRVGADVCPKTKEGSAWAQMTTLNLWVVRVGRRLGGPEASAKFLLAVNTSVVTVRGFSKMFFNWGNVQWT